jgi:hypothetical protein
MCQRNIHIEAVLAVFLSKSAMSDHDIGFKLSNTVEQLKILIPVVYAAVKFFSFNTLNTRAAMAKPSFQYNSLPTHNDQ